jgi:hypothetical protein
MLTIMHLEAGSDNNGELRNVIADDLILVFE